MKLDLDASKTNQEATKQEQQDPETKDDRPLSPPQCSSDMSTLTTSDNSDHIINHELSLNNNNNNNNDNSNNADSAKNDLALDEDFWSEVLSADNSGETSDYFPATSNGAEQEFQFSFSPLVNEEGVHLHLASSSSMCDSMDFWYDVYARAEELTELLEL